MTINIVNQYIKNIYYIHIYLNPVLINKLLIILYRIILGLIAISCFLNDNNNILLILQLIDTYQMNYLNDNLDNNFVYFDKFFKIYDKDLNNSIDLDKSIIYDTNLDNLYILNINPINQGGSSSNNSFKFGPSGRGPGGGDPVGTELTTENENMRKRKKGNINNNIEPKIRDDAGEFKFIKKRKLFHNFDDFKLRTKIPDRNT